MNKHFSALFIFCIFGVIYYLGSFTKIPFGDCIGFVLSVEKDEWATTATAMSHFLYINTVLLIKSLTQLNAIEASRLLMITSGAATVSTVYLSVKTLVKKEWISIASAIVFGFSFSFWRNVEIVEVYAYNSLWVGLFCLSIIKVFSENKKKYIILSSLFLGLGLWVHIQDIFLIPSLLVFLFCFKHEKKYVYYSLLLFVVLFSSLFILNILQGLPFSSPYASDEGTWVEDTFKKAPIQYIKDFFISLVYLVYNFNVFTFFGIAGCIVLYRSNRNMFFVFLVGAVCVYGFSTFYAVSDNYVFFLPFNIIFAISIGYGLSSARYTSLRKVSWVALLIPLGYFLCYTLIFSTDKGKETHAFKSYKGGLNYYLLPWMNDNVGILEFTIDQKEAPEIITWMTRNAIEYTEILKSKGYTEKEIKKL